VRDVVQSNGLRLAAHLARPAGAVGAGRLPALVLSHGFPAGPRGAATAAQTYPQLADRLAAEAGWIVLAFNFRGTGSSEGDFSLGGWVQDLHAAIEHLDEVDAVGGVWLAGASTGGALSLCVAAADERVRGVATLGAPADFDHWAGDARGLLGHARQVGAVQRPSFPEDMATWTRELRETRPLALIGRIPPRPVLIVHGEQDEVVPAEDARALADAARGGAELRIISGAGHRLRHDPRAVAILLGWLERQTP